MIAAASRTTLALTQAQGSPAVNVLPTRASISANLRLLWGDTQESVLQQLRQWIQDPEVEIVVQSGDGPRPDSQCTQGWEALCGAIGATWPQAVVTPYLMVASTDSRHWRDICPNVYRFSAKAVTSQEKATVHGNNERIRVENTRKAAEFFVRLMETC
jgi:carboxypeptidase PM20D1